MHIALDNVSRKYAGKDHLYPLSLTLAPGAINVLLGATQAGKTSLLRLMAGLDQPDSGQIIVDGRNVTGMPVRERNLAMVYQQFINYPSFTVFDNIASPLRIQRIQRTSESAIRKRVHEIAERLHITPYLQSFPAQLSGGQQQRTALARALIKEAGLLLLDEPLVNLDYKLREELRNELAALFSDNKTTVVYASTEPQEALQLGGYVAVLHEGRLLQHGPALSLFRAPNCIETARAFSDPPINLFSATIGDHGVAHLGSGVDIPLNAAQRERVAQHRHVTLGLRAHHLRLTQQYPDDLLIGAEVELSEISGSESFVHLQRGYIALIAQVPGVHELEIGASINVYCRAADMLIFGPDGALLLRDT